MGDDFRRGAECCRWISLQTVEPLYTGTGAVIFLGGAKDTFPDLLKFSPKKFYATNFPRTDFLQLVVTYQLCGFTHIRVFFTFESYTFLSQTLLCKCRKFCARVPNYFCILFKYSTNRNFLGCAALLAPTPLLPLYPKCAIMQSMKCQRSIMRLQYKAKQDLIQTPKKNPDDILAI